MRQIIDINNAINVGEDILIEKSRDMGFSWLTLGLFLWRMLHETGFNAGIGSRKKELVDELDSMKALFPKVRFMLRYLPYWLRGGYDERVHSKLCHIQIPSMTADSWSSVPSA